MTAERRYLNLNAYLRNSGYHEAAWRVSPADPASVLDPRHYIELARTAERGVLDSIFLPDSPGVAEFRSEYLPGAGFDPLQLLSAAASSEFRWRNLANLSGLDYTSIGPDAPFPPGLLGSAAKTSFGASIYKMAAEEPAATFRAIAQKLSALPGGLDFTGTPEGLAQLMTGWWDAGAADGFTIMPNVLPGQLTAFVDHVVPILQKQGIARTEYAGTTLRDHVGLPRAATPTGS